MDKKTFIEIMVKIYDMGEQTRINFEFDVDQVEQHIKDECAKIADKHIIITKPKDVEFRTKLNILRSAIAKAIREE